MRKFTVTAVTPILLLAGHMALAQSFFEVADDNDDGRVSKEEFYDTISRAGVFERVDTNADNRIDEEELEAALEVDAVLLEWERVGSQPLDRRAFYNGIYRYMDRDSDGYLSTFDWDDPDDQGWFGVFEDAP